MQSTTNEGKGHIPQEITLADFLSGTSSPAQITVQRGSGLREQSCLRPLTCTDDSDSL